MRLLPLLFLFLSSVFPGVKFLGVINLLQIHQDERVSRRDGGLREGPHFLNYFLMETLGLTIYLKKKKKDRTNTGRPRSSLFWSSYSDSMEIAWLCLLISRRNCFQLQVMSLLLDSKGVPWPLIQAEEQGGLISENVVTTALSEWKPPTAPPRAPQMLELKALGLLGKENSQTICPSSPPPCSRVSCTACRVLCTNAICRLRGGL